MTEKANTPLSLYLLFSEKGPLKVKENDIILTSSEFLFSAREYYKGIRVFCIDEFKVPFRAIVDDAVSARKDFVEKNNLHRETQFLLEANYNVIVNNLMVPALKWKIAIQELIGKYDFTEIVFSDIISNSAYMPFYEAEGEIHRALLYKKFDFIPKLIERYIKETTKLKVRHLRSRSKLGLALRIFLRRYVFFIFLLFGYLVKKSFSLMMIPRDEPKVLPPENPFFLFLSRGIAHSHYFYPFLKKYINSTIHTAESFFEFNKNNNFFKENAITTIVALHQVTYFEIFKNFFRCFRLLLKPTKRTELSVYGLSFPYTSMEKEIIIASFHLLVYEASIEGYLKQISTKDRKNIVLLSGEMFTAFPWVVKRAADKYHLKSFQVQTTLMMSFPQVDFISCDKFLFKSEEICNLYQETNPSYKEKMGYWGNLVALEEEEVQQGNNERILFFTQPYEESVEQQILKCIKKFDSKKRGLKLHPRDDESKFVDFMDTFDIISGKKHIDDYLSEFDVCILRTSSIAQDIILKGIPVIFCLFSDFDKSIQADYLEENYYGLVHNEEELRVVLNNPQKLYTAFREFRINYIEKGNLGKGIEHFEKKLTEFAST